MTFLIVGGLMIVVFLFSVLREPRRFSNSLLLMGALLLLYIGVAEVTSHIEYMQILSVAFLFGLVPFVIAVMAVLLIINGFVMLKKEGRRLKNLLSLFTGIAMLLGLGIVFLFFYADTRSMTLISLLWLGAILSAYFALTFLALLIYSVLYMHLPKRKDCDYIIVHGCGLLGGERISPLLKGRVDKAVEVYEKTGGTAKLVLSGGQGTDEKIAEAQAMKNYLLESGFPEEKLILESDSTTTYENLRNVRDMLDTSETKHRYLFVTNNYHIFRTGLFARKLKMDADGVGCKTAAYYWATAFIREYVAIMVRFRWLTIAVLLLWLVMLIVSLLPI